MARALPHQMKHLLPSRRFWILAPAIATAVMACLRPGAALHAQTYTWMPTAGGTTYDWGTATQSNWGTSVGGLFPNTPGDIADVNNNIAGAQTIRLQQGITIGQLNLGDSDGSHSFTVSSGTGTQTLTFEGASAGAATTLNLASAGSVMNFLSASVALGGTSSLTINASGGQRLTTQTGAFDTNGNSVTVTGGTTQTATWTATGDLLGNGTITMNALGGMTVLGAKTFTGTFVLNRGLSGSSNAGSLSVTGGSIANAAEVVINGYFINGNSQQGGSLQACNNSAQATNPVQRFTSNTITLNGGTLTANGQLATTGTANPWQMGQELVQDTVATLNINSGYSQVFMGVGGNTLGTRLNVTALERRAGATAWGRSSTWGGTAQMSFANINSGNDGGSFLIGAGGPDGSTTMSIIPWMGASLTNGFAANPDGFVTHTATGIRALNTSTEYASSITAGAVNNVSTSAITLAADTTVNSLRYTSSATGNFGTGRTLTVASGGVFFATTGSLGGSDSATAGVLNFGPAEGVVWANGTNTNGIGASISGSKGLTKAGTGTLILNGNNNYSGLTYVSGGTLQVGDATHSSILGVTGDVTISSGSFLVLFDGESIADTATLTLEQYGLFNGVVNMNAGVNEIVGALMFGDTIAAAGTYGSTSSGAEFQDDTFFSGAGMLVVVPEPGSAVMLLGGAAMLLGRRRRRA